MSALRKDESFSWFLLFMAAAAADAFLTYAMWLRGFEEANPLLRPLLSENPYPFMSVRLLAAFAVGLAALAWSKRARWLLQVGTLITCVAVGWNLGIASLHW